MGPKPDDRSALSIGLDWGTRITTIGLEFALPACIGFGLDRWWHTGPWLTIAGSMLGLLMGMMHMVRLASTLSQSPPTGLETRGPARTRSSGPRAGDKPS